MTLIGQEKSFATGIQFKPVCGYTYCTTLHISLIYRVTPADDSKVTVTEKEF